MVACAVAASIAPQLGSTILLLPIWPIDILAVHKLEMSGVRITVCKQHQIRTRKSCTRHQHAVEFEKVCSGRDRLRRAIFECFISGAIDAKKCQFTHVDEAQRALRPDSQNMYLVLNEARPHRFERKSEADLGQSSVALFAGVKNFKFSRRTPSAVCGRASQRISAFAGHAPYI